MQPQKKSNTHFRYKYEIAFSIPMVENYCFDSCCKDVSTSDYQYIGNQLKPKASCEVVMGMPREIGFDPRNKQLMRIAEQFNEALISHQVHIKNVEHSSKEVASIPNLWVGSELDLYP